MKKFVSLVLTLFLVVSLTACGKSSRAGNYQLVSVGNEQITYNNEESPLSGLVNNAYSLTLNEDGTGKMSVLGFETQLTWDNKTIKIDNTEYKIEFKGDTLTILADDKDGTMVFKKKK